MIEFHWVRPCQLAAAVKKLYYFPLKKMSRVWQYFEFDGKESKCICNVTKGDQEICGKQIPRNFTTNLKNHFCKAHPEVYTALLEKEEVEKKAEKQRLRQASSLRVSQTFIRQETLMLTKSPLLHCHVSEKHLKSGSRAQNAVQGCFEMHETSEEGWTSQRLWPRPPEFQGSAASHLLGLLQKVRGKQLFISPLYDCSCHHWSDPTEPPSSQYCCIRGYHDFFNKR